MLFFIAKYSQIDNLERIFHKLWVNSYDCMYDIGKLFD